MYTLESAVAKPQGNDNRWVTLDISTMKLVDLLMNYKKVYVVLTNPFIDHKVTLDLEEIRAKYSVSKLTFTEFLTETGNKNLPTIDSVPVLSNRYVKYRDGVMAGYKITPVNSKKSPDADIPKGDKKDLYLTKKGLDFTEFGDYCMVSVNGFYHYVDTDSKGAWVIDGMKSNAVCKENYLGITSFKEVGKIQHKHITKEMLFKLSEIQDYRYQLGIDVGENINNKTIALVIGGYFHILDNRIFYQYNDNCIIVNTAKMNLLSRYQEMRQYLNLEELPFERSSRNESMVVVDDFLSDENLEALFTMSQSFLVLIDNTELFTETEYLRTPPTPGLLITPSVPDRPIFHRFGKLADYWWQKGCHFYAVQVGDNQWSRLQSETIQLAKLPATGDSEQTQMPVDLSPAFFLKIGCDLELK